MTTTGTKIPSVKTLNPQQQQQKDQIAQAYARNPYSNCLLYQAIIISNYAEQVIYTNEYGETPQQIFSS